MGFYLSLQLNNYLIYLNIKDFRVESWGKNLVFINKSNIINEIDISNNMVGKTKSKNIVMLDFLVKSKLLVELSFKAGFLTSWAR